MNRIKFKFISDEEIPNDINGTIGDYSVEYTVKLKSI